ncbi:MAG: plasmid pRiA4b ORF-3 family protein [Micromonosporaceae bacterium]|nr:plasmid pRiA4b ORF-3 family protein [Micromonosporaceae bacterium]
MRGSKPPIWRRLEVPSDTTLDGLHQVIQTGFGWYGGHLWVFETPDGEYGQPDAQLGHVDAATVTLDEVAPDVGDRIRYVYDFGDDWQHDLVVEQIVAAQPGVAYPRCTAGRRARPPEDCGGMWVYQDLLAVVADPGHPEHAEALDTLRATSAAAFDPARFDRDTVNARLSNPAAGSTSRLWL